MGTRNDDAVLGYQPERFDECYAQRVCPGSNEPTDNVLPKAIHAHRMTQWFKTVTYSLSARQFVQARSGICWYCSAIDEFIDLFQAASEQVCMSPER